MTPLDLKKLRVQPLAHRKSLARIEEIMVNPDGTPPLTHSLNRELIARCAERIAGARKRDRAVMLVFGAHLIKNGAADIIIRLMEHGWITHLATNGAGVIHDWEFAHTGSSTESVRENVETGTFGAWEETGRNIHLAILSGSVDEKGFGRSLGQFVNQEGIVLPEPESLEAAIAAAPGHPLTAARAELLRAMRENNLPAGRLDVPHGWKAGSVLAQSFRFDIPLTVHPGIGYDIIAAHPLFNGAAIGRAADLDFRLFAATVDRLDSGVVMSVGSAIMGPQVFEKSLSCVNNLRLQAERNIVHDHEFFVVDLQDGGAWDWSKGEPPKDNPAYYLRFCKSYSRMGGAMHYLQCDNVLFLHRLLWELEPKA